MPQPDRFDEEAIQIVDRVTRPRGEYDPQVRTFCGGDSMLAEAIAAALRTAHTVPPGYVRIRDNDHAIQKSHDDHDRIFICVEKLPESPQILATRAAAAAKGAKP